MSKLPRHPIYRQWGRTVNIAIPIKNSERGTLLQFMVQFFYLLYTHTFTVAGMLHMQIKKLDIILNADLKEQ